MAPGSNKRKRPERGYSYDDNSGRPSPHRPDGMQMAQGRSGNGRGGRGGMHRRQSRNNDPQSPIHSNSSQNASRNTAYRTGPHPAQTEPAPIIGVSEPSTPIPRREPSPHVSRQESPIAPRPPPAPYAYEHISEEMAANWQERGEQTLLTLANVHDEFTRCSILFELLRSALDGRLSPNEGGLAVAHLISADQGEEAQDTQTLFVNTVSLLDDLDSKNPALLTVIKTAGIDPEMLRLELDIPLLGALDMVRPAFGQMRTRKTTNILYRQANFNLLREESEGYAKLLTEYFNTAQEASSSRDSNPDMADDAFQRVKALIGAFDLDVGRVLDITLDISANLLVKAYGFFMKFYRCSSWWPNGEAFDSIKWADQGFSSFPAWALPGSGRTAPSDDDREQLLHLREARDVAFWQRVTDVGMAAFYELGARTIVDYDSVAELLASQQEPELDVKGKENRADKRKRINEDRRYMRETRTLPPIGNPDAAQLLGFKLRYYASTVRDAQDAVPENLIALAALLIKIGFISLRDLYPHLYPPDDQMPQERTRLEKEKAEKEMKERPGAGPNALVLAGALTDDTPAPAVRTLRVEKDKSGASTPNIDKKEDGNEAEEAKLPPPDNQKIMLLRALLLVGALPEALYILGRFPWLAEVDTSIPPYLLRIGRQMLSKISRTTRPLNDRDISQARGQIADTAAKPGEPLAFTTRPLKKPIRWLGLDRVDPKDGQEYRYYYADWADNIPVCQSTEDVFLLCDTFFGFLGVKIGQDPEVLGSVIRLAKVSLEEDDSEANRSRWLDLMKRLLVPALSFTQHNPGLTNAVFELLLRFPMTTRFSIYAEWFMGKTSRLPDMRVALNYNKAEAKDVLRRVTNDTGKKYARALAKISYSSPGVVMMYMISQLESYNNMIPALVECARFFPAMAYDVLSWCLINSLNGGGKDRMQADGMLTSPWLQALSSFVASLFSRYSQTLDPTPILQYLASELRAGNSTDLEMFEQLLGEMAGVKTEHQFTDAQVQAMAGGPHLQSIILQQLSDTRHARKSPAKRLLRALSEPGLVGQLLVAVAQERQMYQYRGIASDMPLKVLGNNVDKVHQILAQYLDVLRSNLTPDEFADAVPDTISLVRDFGLEPGIAFTLYRSVIVHRMAEYDESKKNEDLEEKKRRQSNEKPSADDDSGMQIAESRSSTADDSPWHPVLQPLIKSLEESCDELDQRVGLPFYVTFWTLSQSDVVVFTESYTMEIDRLSKQMAALSPQRNDSSATIKEKERKKKSLQDTSDSLRHEVKSRVALYSKVSNRLSHREKAHWFPKVNSRQELDARHVKLLQECFLPRAMLSPLDAHYSYLMFRMLHDKGTPGFSTANLLSQLFRKHELAAIIFQCTALEAQHLGRFLNEVLRMLLQWHGDKAIYEKEAIGTKTKLPGFAKPFDTDKGPEVFVDYESFRRLVSNWHTALNGAMQVCLDSGEYCHIRNGIMISKAICQHFPALNYMGRNLLNHVTRLSQEESRADLKLMAMSLIAPLKNREKSWVDAAHFRLGDPAKDARLQRPASEAPQGGQARLNAAAPEFSPLPVEASTKLESVVAVEDGEVEDEKANPAADVPMADAEQTSKDDSSRDQGNRAASEQPKDRFTATPTRDARGPDVRNSQARSNEAPRNTHSSEYRPNTPHVLHGLPSRPERPITRGPAPARHLPHPSSARTNSRRDDIREKADRPVELINGSREHSPNRNRTRTSPPPPRQMHSRDERQLQRVSRDDLHGDARRDGSVHASQSGRSNLADSATTNPMAGAHPDRAGFIGANSGAGPPSGGSQHNENPARLAQINGEHQEQDVRTVRPDSRVDIRMNNRLETARQTASHVEPTPDTPTGPRRGTNRSSAREMGPPHHVVESSYGRLNGSHDNNASPRGLPQAPAARTNRTASVAASEVNATSAPVPSGPTASSDEPPLVGVHPSRMAQLNATPGSNSNNAVTSPQGPRNASFQANAPGGPRGAPRGNGGASGGASPMTSQAPIGPVGPAERHRRTERNGQRSNIATINATLQNTSASAAPPARDVSFRGASSRPSHPASTDTAVQSVASPMEPPQRRGEPNGPGSQQGRNFHNADSRPELFQGRADASGRERDRNISTERGDGAFRRGGQTMMHADDERDKRFSWDPRDSHDRRGAGPDVSGYGGTRTEWDRPTEPRVPTMRDAARGNVENRRGGRQSGRGDEFRGPNTRRTEDRSEDNASVEGRKRRHEDGHFDPTKRRRSAR